MKVAWGMERAGAHERANEALAWRSARSALPRVKRTDVIPSRKRKKCQFEISLRFI